MAMSPRRSRRSIQSATDRTRTVGSRLGKLAHDALAHLGRGLPRERDRQDVGRIDAALEQVDVARDEDRRLAGSRRRLENDVVRGIDRKACARSRRDRARRTSTS